MAVLVVQGAVQRVAFVDVQRSVELDPEMIEVGVADSVTVGAGVAGGGGGVTGGVTGGAAGGGLLRGFGAAGASLPARHVE